MKKRKYPSGTSFEYELEKLKRRVIKGYPSITITRKAKKKMGELEVVLSGLSVRQLIVAMRLMAPGTGTLGFDYSKVRKEDLAARAHAMATSLPKSQQDKILGMLGEAFGWKSDISGKATGVGGSSGSGRDAGRSSVKGGSAYGKGDYGGTDEHHGPEQGGRAEGEPGPSKEDIEKAIQEGIAKGMQQKTDELMDKISKSVFKIEITEPGDGEGDESGEDESEGDESGESQEQSDGQEGSDGESRERESESGENGEGNPQRKKSKGRSGKKKRVIEADRPRHEVFKEVCHAVNQGLNVLLVGPAGCGKTHMAQDIAQTLDMPFKFTGAVSSEYKLLGFMTAQGQLVRTEYREAYENGGLFLWDELDGSSAQALLSFNAGLANGHQDFPDKVVPQHKNFRAMASANTYGNGADRMYIGRNQLDAASLDRFYVVSMDYDDQLEQALYGRNEWVMYVQAARRAMRSIGGIRHVISMRAIQMGLKMQTTDVPREMIEQACLWRHLRQDDVDKIKKAMR